MGGRKRRPHRPHRHTDAMTDAVRQLQDEVRELRNAVVELRSEAGQYRAETEQLRKELQARGPAQEAAAATARPEQFDEAAPTGSVGRTCRHSGRIFPVADQQTGRPVPDQSGGGVKIPDPAFGHCAAESVQQSRISWIVRTFPPGRFRTIPNVSGQTFGASLRQSEIGLEVFGPRFGWGAGPRETCNLISPADSPNTPMESISVWRGCASPACGWIGKIPPSWPGRTTLSSLRSRRLHSLRWPCLHSVMPGISGDGFRKFASSTALICRKGRTSRCRAASWTTLPESCPRVLRALRAGGREFGTTGLRCTRGVDAQRFRHASDAGRGRLLQPPELGFQSHHVDGWAAMTDWSVPLARRVSLTGEFYRGRAHRRPRRRSGAKRALQRRSQSAGVLRALNSVGGWSQLKVQGHQQTGVQRRVRSGQSVCRRCAGLSFESGYFPLPCCRTAARC